ncbi:MAG TPA: hypothetical protein VH164_09710 [Ktedonobacteraceae bacterium]|jgi:hypothetical protein|nr:hypothetical protein [Ktedonobacteraceae bacterium]
MSSTGETMTPEEEKQNHRYSFVVGIFIAMAIIILFTAISLFVH